MYNRQLNLTICFLLLYMFLIQNLHIMLQMHYYIPSGFPENSPLRRLSPLRLPKMPYGYFSYGLTQAVFEPHLFSVLPRSDHRKDLSGWFPYVRIPPHAAPLHGNISCQNGNMSTPLISRIHSFKQMQSVTKLTFISRSWPLKSMGTSLYKAFATYIMQGNFTLLLPATVSTWNIVLISLRFLPTPACTYQSRTWTICPG